MFSNDSLVRLDAVRLIEIIIRRQSVSLNAVLTVKRGRK